MTGSLVRSHWQACRRQSESKKKCCITLKLRSNLFITKNIFHWATSPRQALLSCWRVTDWKVVLNRRNLVLPYSDNVYIHGYIDKYFHLDIHGWILACIHIHIHGYGSMPGPGRMRSVRTTIRVEIYPKTYLSTFHEYVNGDIMDTSMNTSMDSSIGASVDLSMDICMVPNRSLIRNRL